MPITNMEYQILCSRSTNNKERELIIMIPISDKEELALDNGLLVTHKSDVTFNIDKHNIIAYGEIDFSDNSDDFNVIQGMRWLDHLDGLGIIVPSEYNYEEHCCYSPIKSYRYYDTTNPAVVAQYFHGILGKPKRCCIFKEKRYGNKTIS